MIEVTKKNWKAYRRVQDSGLYNMLSPDAVRSSGLDRDIYFEIIKNYDRYEDEFENNAI